ncbi:MAG TPA: hypothetical protein VNS58_14605 [Puia sp.]|nr:hypothetical protein [Puia sp.]
MKKHIRSSAPALLLLASLSGYTVLYGQSPVTSFSASYVTTGSSVSSYTALPASPGSFGGCSPTSYLYTFSNGLSNQYKLNSFNANGSTYFVAPAASATVKLRRVNNSNATGNRSIVYMESTAPSASACPSPATLNFKPPYLDVMETVLNVGMLNQGTDNIFTNAGNGDGNNNNIERVDVIFSSGLNTASPPEAGFAIFDRGNNYQHDPFKIAAITSLDANGDPASFGPVRTCTSGNGSNNNGSWGHPSAANGNLSFSIYVLRKDASAPRLQVSSNLNQEIGGVFYTFADLGITAGQALYGYALLAADGTASPSSAQLLNLNNTAVYPTGTTEAQGGLDLVAVNTVFSTGSYIVLPVQIASFTGSMQQDATGAPAGRQLQWELGNVEGDEQVCLERSADGVAFSTVYSTTISSAAPSLSMKYTDMSGISGSVFYYRLKVTIPSGSSQYSNTLALHGDGADAGWKIYPTVAERSQRLKLQGIRDGDYTVVFYDYGGGSRKVPVHVLNQEAWIDPPSGGLVPGIYWLQLSGNGQAIAGGAKVFVR